jgi:hypothetical protein
MRWLAGGLMAASLVSITVFPARATTTSCGGGFNAINVELTVPGLAPASWDCNSGTGVVLATGSDPTPFTVIDTAHGGPVPLTVLFSNSVPADGTFLFNPLNAVGYTNIHIGFQLTDTLHLGFINITPDPINPDWITLALGSNTSGSFDADFIVHVFNITKELFSDPILYLVLYGTPVCPEENCGGGGPAVATPLPGALALFAGGAGFLGLLVRRRNRRTA